MHGLQGLPAALHGLHGLQAFAAAHGLHGLQAFAAAHGLQALAAAHGLHGLQALAALQGLQGLQAFAAEHGLQGLQAFITYNVIHFLFSTLRNAGVILWMLIYEATLEAFFIYQSFIAAFELLVLYVVFHRRLPIVTFSFRFKFSNLRKISNFALGAFIGLVILFVITNADRLFVFSSTSLIDYGYYCIAITVSNALFLLTAPINDAIQPRLTVLVSLGRDEDVWLEYIKSTKLLACIIIPVSVSISFYPEHFLYLWAQEDLVIERVAPYIRFLILGSLIYSLANMSRIISLAYGTTKVLVISNFIVMLIFLPFEWFLVKEQGALGGSLGWLLVNLFILFTMPLVVHYKLVGRFGLDWYLDGFLLILIGCLFISCLSLFFLPRIPVSIFGSIGGLLTLLVLLYCYTYVMFKKGV